MQRHAGAAALAAEARERAVIVLALFEGAGLVCHARADLKPFTTAIDYGATLYERD